jgi:hypothetical protein
LWEPVGWASWFQDHFKELYFFLLLLLVLGLNSGPRACKAGILLLEPHLQSILIWLFWRWNLTNCLSGLASNHSPSDLSFPIT